MWLINVPYSTVVYNAGSTKILFSDNYDIYRPGETKKKQF